MRKFSTARWTCLSGSLNSSATSSAALPPGGSYSSATSMLVVAPRSSKRTAPAFWTSASPTLFQAMRWLGTSSTISASHSTDLPSRPATFQWLVVGAGDGDLLDVGHERREVGEVAPVGVHLLHWSLDLEVLSCRTHRGLLLPADGW